MALTLDSLDDSLIERKQKEIAELKEENNQLRIDLSHMIDAKKEWNDKFNNLVAKLNHIEQENQDLKKKLLHYEHDPIIIDMGSDGEIDILYWDTETNDYEVFACFYDNKLESDMEEFCKEFIMELKDAYMVE